MNNDLETRLRELALLHDYEALCELVLRGYGPELYAFLVRTIDSEEDAIEVYAQFCEDLWRGLEGFQWRSSMRTWLYRLVRSARARYVSDAYFRRREVWMPEKLAAIAEEVRSSTEVWLRDEFRREIAEIRAQLDEEARELLFMRVDQSMSWAEIAEVLEGTTDARVAQKLRTRFHRIKNRIREMAIQRGLLDS